MGILVSFFWLVFLGGVQAASGIPSFETGELTDSEKSQIEREKNVEGRIKIYTAVSARFNEAVKQDFQHQTFENISKVLHPWLKFLTHALADIQQNVERRKKSKNLIHCEIQLRKALAEVKEYRLQSPNDLNSEYDSFLTQAEAVRRKFVDIIFLR